MESRVWGPGSGVGVIFRSGFCSGGHRSGSAPGSGAWAQGLGLAPGSRVQDWDSGVKGLELGLGLGISSGVKGLFQGLGFVVCFRGRFVRVSSGVGVSSKVWGSGSSPGVRGLGSAPGLGLWVRSGSGARGQLRGRSSVVEGLGSRVRCQLSQAEAQNLGSGLALVRGPLWVLGVHGLGLWALRERSRQPPLTDGCEGGPGPGPSAAAEPGGSTGAGKRQPWPAASRPREVPAGSQRRGGDSARPPGARPEPRLSLIHI